MDELVRIVPVDASMPVLIVLVNGAGDADLCQAQCWSLLPINVGSFM
jgi:hypothetical protein